MALALERLASTHGKHTEYIDQILNAFTEQQLTPDLVEPLQMSTSSTLNLLTDRELDVLALLGGR